MARIRDNAWLFVMVSALAAACNADSSSTDGAPDAADAGDEASLDLDARDDFVDDGTPDSDAFDDAARDTTDAGDTRDVVAEPRDDDGDGVPDGSDVCDGSDDTVDLNDDQVPDCTQNVLPNGGFDGTLNPWIGAEYAPSTDANGMSRSGSALLSFIEGGPFVPFVAHCQMVEPGVYGLYSQSFVASGQEVEADTGVRVQAFSEPFCDVAEGYVTVVDRIVETPTDAWTTLSIEITVTPDRPYLAIYIVLEPTANDDVDGFVDNVLLVSE